MTSAKGKKKLLGKYRRVRKENISKSCGDIRVLRFYKPIDQRVPTRLISVEDLKDCLKEEQGIKSLRKSYERFDRESSELEENIDYRCKMDNMRDDVNGRLRDYSDSVDDRKE